ncbi:MAG TPA: chorismate mutase [Candidatus Nanoarchaeia archaeon]|nr:chorismate mutase [Candidatus Nanoarchaeia archaeon]
MSDLKQLRKKIDSVDEKILLFLAERVKVCEDIGLAKKSQGLPVHDPKREEEVFNLIRTKAMELGLSPIQVQAVYREIVNMCSSVQE